MINKILFHLDNTLLDFSKAEQIALTETLTQLRVPPKEAVLSRYSALNSEQWKLLEQGKIGRDEVKVRRYQLLFDELGVTHPAEEAAALYESLLGIGHYFMIGAEEVLQELFSSYHLYITTNGIAQVQRRRIESAELERYFQDIFISEEIGFNKPSRDFFDCCFARIPNFQRESAIIVGDSLSSDIQGGINAGIKTVWFNPERVSNNSNLLPDYEIFELKEILGILEMEGK